MTEKDKKAKQIPAKLKQNQVFQ